MQCVCVCMCLCVCVLLCLQKGRGNQISSPVIVIFQCNLIKLAVGKKRWPVVNSVRGLLNGKLTWICQSGDHEPPVPEQFRGMTWLEA